MPNPNISHKIMLSIKEGTTINPTTEGARELKEVDFNMYFHEVQPRVNTL